MGVPEYSSKRSKEWQISDSLMEIEGNVLVNPRLIYGLT